MKTIQPGCTKMAIDQLLLAAASSDLVGGKKKCYFITTCGCCLSVKLYRTEIRPNASITTEKKSSDKSLALLINRHVCLVFSSFKICHFPI